MLVVSADYETLNSVLDRLGYQHFYVGPPSSGCKRLLLEGKEHFSGLAHQVWGWLVESGQIKLIDYDRENGAWARSYNC